MIRIHFLQCTPPDNLVLRIVKPKTFSTPDGVTKEEILDFRHAYISNDHRSPCDEFVGRGIEIPEVTFRTEKGHLTSMHKHIRLL